MANTHRPTLNVFILDSDRSLFFDLIVTLLLIFIVE